MRNCRLLSTRAHCDHGAMSMVATEAVHHNRVIQRDCTQALQNLGSESVDLVLTDPPYFVCYKDRSGRSIANDTNPDSVLGAFTDIYRVLKPTKVLSLVWHQ